MFFKDKINIAFIYFKGENILMAVAKKLLKSIKKTEYKDFGILHQTVFNLFKYIFSCLFYVFSIKH